MKSWNEIQNMTPEEVTAEKNKLAKQIVLKKFIIPIAITAVVHYGINYLVNRMEDAPAED